MSAVINAIEIFNITTIALMSGIYLIFSNTVIPSFKALSGKAGAVAMVKINKVILNPIFYLVFFGSTLSSVILLFLEQDLLETIAHITFIIGMFIVTVIFNVPLNNKLMHAADHNEHIEEVWAFYAEKWLLWNHVRTITSTVAIILLVI